MISAEDAKFLAHRSKLTRYWPIVGGLILAGIACMIGWLYLTAPFLIDPFYTAKAIAEGQVERSSLELSAVLLPVVVLVLWTVLAVFVGFSFVISANERRYQRLIGELLAERASQSERSH